MRGAWEQRGLWSEALTLQLHPSPIGGSARDPKSATAAWSESSLDSAIPAAYRGSTVSLNADGDKDGVNDRQPSPRFNHALVPIPPVETLGVADGYGYRQQAGGGGQDGCRQFANPKKGGRVRAGAGGGNGYAYGNVRSSSDDGCGWGLAVVGGVHGGMNVDLDEIGLYDVGRDEWHLNVSS